MGLEHLFGRLGFDQGCGLAQQVLQSHTGPKELKGCMQESEHV